MKLKMANIYYSLIYEFLIIPLLCLMTYSIYDKFAYTDVVVNNPFGYILLIVLLVVFNIVCIYIVAYIYNRFFKTDGNYYTIIGILTIGIIIWFKVFWYVMEIVNCNHTASDRCVEAIQGNKLSTYILIASISYYVIYQVFHQMLLKKLK